MNSESETRKSESYPPAARQWNVLFWTSMSAFGLLYLVFVLALIAADLQFTSWQDIQELFADDRIKFSIYFSLISCTISALLSVWIAIPTGYVLARFGRDAIRRRFEHRPMVHRVLTMIRHTVDTILDIPIVLPPLVVGISLLVLFQTPLGKLADETTASFFQMIGFPGLRGITYEMPAVVFGQFTVAAAFAIRTMRDTFEQISDRPERIALTLGASSQQAFSRVAMPQAWRGSVAAFTLAWARSLGEFGPILIFAGTARMKTEVLSTTVYLNFQFGNLRGAVAASLILVSLAIGVLVVTRILMLSDHTQKGLIA